MEPEEYKIMFFAEEKHWWYKGMAEITRTVIEKCYPQGYKLRILDAGCGTGGGMSLLSDYGTVTGFDFSHHAICFTRTRGHERLAVASIMEIPFADNSFDLITSTDVLYFENVRDGVVLEEFSRVLVPGGRVILRVPAFDWLRGYHDTKISTGHRYSLPELSKKLKENNLVPEMVSYANTILFPIIAMKRLLERWLPFQTGSDLTIDIKCLDKIFKYCLILESRLIKKHSLPFGLSIIGVGQKPIS